MSSAASPINTNKQTTPSSKRNKKRNKNKNKQANNQSVSSPISHSVVEEEDQEIIEDTSKQPVTQTVSESHIQSNKFDKNISVEEPVKVTEYTNEPINQTISQPIEQSIRLDSQPITQNLTADTLKNHVFDQPTSQSVDRLSSGSVDEPVKMVANLSSNAALNQSDWQSTQSKTFLRWANYYLSQRNLTASFDQSNGHGKNFTDGILLCNLIEILSGTKLGKFNPNPKNQVQRLDNLSVAFRYLENNEKMKLVNLRINDIEAGNEKMTMALMWGLIVHWQIEKIAKLVKQRKLEAAEAAKKAAEANNQTHTATVTEAAPAVEQTTEQPAVDAVPLLAETSALSAKAELLAWVNSKVLLYDVAPVRDFSSSFADGRALACLTDALLVEQVRLLSVMKTNAIEHEAEHVSQDGKKVLDMPSDPLECATAAIIRAENELRIPPLIDASDLVQHPHEQAIMTYIACFRDREQTLATIGHEVHVELPVVEAEPAEVLAVVTDEQAPLNDQDLIENAATTEEPAKQEEEMLSLSNDTSLDESAPAVERVDVAPLVTSEQPDHSVEHVETVTTPVALRTAEMNIDPEAASAATLNPPGTPTHVVQAAPVEQPQDLSIDQSTDASSYDQSPDDEKHVEQEPAGLVAAQQFHAADDEMKQTAPPQSQPSEPVKPAQSNQVTEVDVCMTNVDLQYVQARPDGSVIVDAANSQWSVWTVIDEQGTDTVFFRDHLGRYMTSSPDGLSVKMGPKTELSRWHVTRGKQQKFQNVAQLYLTARDGAVVCEPNPSMHANLTLNFPVIEGYLRKKGSSGLKRWQSRYFAFNGAVMSYWSRKEEAGVNRIPKGVYYPKHIALIEREKSDPSKFSIKFTDDKIVVLDANTPAEADRWIHSLEMTGVKVQ